MSSALQIDTAIASISTRSGAPRPAVAEYAANDDLEFEFNDAKWPAWKTTSFILLTCGAFWTTVIFVGVQIFQAL